MDTPTNELQSATYSALMPPLKCARLLYLTATVKYGRVGGVWYPMLLVSHAAGSAYGLGDGVSNTQEKQVLGDVV